MAFMKIKRYHWVVAVMLLVAGIVSYLWVYNPKPLVQKNSELTIPLVQTLPIALTKHRPNHIIYAESEVETPFQVVSTVSGHVTQLPVSMSNRVESGALLLQLDTDQSQRDRERVILDLQQVKSHIRSLDIKRGQLEVIIDSSEKKLAWYQRQVARQETLSREHLISDQTLERSQSQLEEYRIAKVRASQQLIDLEQQQVTSKARLDRLKVDLIEINDHIEHAQFTSPSRGRVDQVYVSEGGYVKAGQTVMTLVPDNQLYLKALITPSIYQQISSNDVDAYVMYGQERVSATFDRFKPYLEGSSRSIEALFYTNENDMLFPLGQRFKLYLEFGRPVNAYLVPLRSVYPGGYIYLIEKDRLKRVDVAVEGYRFAVDQETQVVVTGKHMPAQGSLLLDPLPDAFNGMLVRVSYD